MSTHQQMAITYSISQVTPGSSTFDSGTTTFTVPAYNTLVVELWGPGGGGCGYSAGQVQQPTGAAGTTTVGTLGLTAHGAGAISVSGGVDAHSPAATASGGNVANTSGNIGGSLAIGTGAGAPNGGGNVAGFGTPGNPGSTPGGGGGGAFRATDGSTASGGDSGAYCKSSYAFGAGGSPAIGAALSYSVGAGGAPSGTTAPGGTGANGRVKFTWS
jgi:hypothetical protein